LLGIGLLLAALVAWRGQAGRAMQQRLDGFTLMELMLALLLASALIALLVIMYTSVWRRYVLFMNLSHLDLEGRSARQRLIQQISGAASVLNRYGKSDLPYELKRRLRPLSNVLVLCEASEAKHCRRQVAYYVAKTSWQHDGKSVTALFEKPLDGRRQELIPYVVGLTLNQALPDGLVGFSVTLRSPDPILKAPLAYYVNGQKKVTRSRYLYRVWYGVSHVKR